MRRDRNRSRTKTKTRSLSLNINKTKNKNKTKSRRARSLPIVRSVISPKGLKKSANKTKLNFNNVPPLLYTNRTNGNSRARSRSITQVPVISQNILNLNSPPPPLPLYVKHNFNYNIPPPLPLYVKNALQRNTLQRAITTTHTQQGEQGSCFIHATVRLYLKNIIEVFYNLKLSKLDEMEYYINKCSLLLKTDEIDKHIKSNAFDKCSINGKKKMVLFLYLYKILKKRYTCDGGMTTVSMSYLLLLFNKMTNKFIESDESLVDEEILSEFGKYSHDILEVFETVQKKMIKDKSRVDFQYIPIKNFDDNFEMNNIDDLFRIFKKLIDCGLYITLSLKTSSIKTYQGHSITIVDYDNEEYGFMIKNTWNTFIDFISYNSFFGYNLLKGNSQPFIITGIYIIYPLVLGMKSFQPFTIEPGNAKFIEYPFQTIAPDKTNDLAKWVDDYSEKLIKYKSK